MDVRRVLWGFGHGFGLLICRFWKRYGVPLPAFAAWAITLSFVVLLFVLFRAPDLATANNIYLGLLGEGGAGAMWALKTSWRILVGGALAVIIHRASSSACGSSRIGGPRPRSWSSLCVLKVGEGAPQSFIYFQF